MWNFLLFALVVEVVTAYPIGVTTENMYKYKAGVSTENSGSAINTIDSTNLDNQEIKTFFSANGNSLTKNVSQMRLKRQLTKVQELLNKLKTPKPRTLLPTLPLKKKATVVDFVPFTPRGRINLLKLVRETPAKASTAVADMFDRLTPHLAEALDILRPEPTNLKSQLHVNKVSKPQSVQKDSGFVQRTVKTMLSDEKPSQQKTKLTDEPSIQKTLKSRLEQNLESLITNVVPDREPHHLIENKHLNNFQDYSPHDMILPEIHHQEDELHKLPYHPTKMIHKFNRLADKVIPIFTNSLSALLPHKIIN